MTTLLLAILIAVVVILSLTAIIFYTKRYAVGVESIVLNKFNTLAFVLFVNFLILFASIISKFFASCESSIGKIYAPTIITQIFTIFAIFVFFKFINAKLSVKPSLFAIKTALKFSSSTILILAGGGAITLFYKYFTGELPPPQMAVELFSELSSTAEIVLAIISIAILAPIFEELFFRALLYPTIKGWFLLILNCNEDSSSPLFLEKKSKLKNRLAIVFSAILVSILFSAIHFSAFAAIPIFIISILLICSYERTGSIITPIIFHSIFNSINVIFLLLGNYVGDV